MLIAQGPMVPLEAAHFNLSKSLIDVTKTRNINFIMFFSQFLPEVGMG